MAGTSKMKDVKSPQEIEEGIKSTKTVTWDPFTVLPKEIYLDIFEKLESPTDKQNFMNAHVKFYELFKSQRTLFLCHQVFEEINRYEENLDWRTFKGSCGYKSYLQCRLVCRDWDKATQKVFQLHKHYFTLEECNYVWPSDLPTFVYDSKDWEPCKSFYWYREEHVKEDLEKFFVTHPPTKNPFYSRSIDLSSFPDVYDDFAPGDLERYRAAVETLLEKYGRHIWHCKIDIERKLNPATCLQIAKWLSLMPELQTLSLKYDDLEVRLPFSKGELKEIENLQLVQPELKNLVVLTSFYLPALVFNKLFGELPQLEKIQIKIVKGEGSLLRNFELGADRSILKEVVVTVKGLDDFNYLRRFKPLPALEKLVISLEYVEDDERKYQAYSKWPEWKMIWEILEEKFPSLEHLNLKLPKAFWDAEKREVICQSFEFRLSLPKLKKLWVALPNFCFIDFLLPCKALEELTVVMEHAEWNSGKYAALRGFAKAKVNLSMDLKNMWESNIWEVFPELCKLEIQAMPKSDSTVLGSYTYEKIGDKRKYSEENIR